MRYFFLVIALLLSSCVVEFKSNQLNMIKSIISGDKRLAPSLQWTVFFEGKQHTAYAVILPNMVRLVSLDYLEIDFKQTYVSAVRTLSPSKSEHTLLSVPQGYQILLQNQQLPINLLCKPLEQTSEYIYIQSCESVEIDWAFTNQLEVNQKREVVYIKSYYSPSKPPIEMYHSPLFKALKN